MPERHGRHSHRGQQQGLSQGRIQSFSLWLARALMAEPVGLFRTSISTVTKAAALTYFSWTQIQASFREFFLMGEAPPQGPLTAAPTGQQHSTIRQYRGLISRQQPLDLPLARAAGSCTRQMPELPGLIRQAEPLQTLMVSVLPATL